MAGNLSAEELAKARAELARVNEQHGFKRHDRDIPVGPVSNGGPASQPAAEGTAPAEPKTQDVGTSVDPGPPRFIGVDIEHKLAGLSGGAAIPVDGVAIEQIVDILLVQLQQHLSRSLGAIADTHHRAKDPAQLEIKFPDEPRAG